MQLVAQVRRRLEQLRRLDDDGRLAERAPLLDEAGDVLVRRAQGATSRISYAGGTPARTASCSRTIPSISASGRGGQNGT